MSVFRSRSGRIRWGWRLGLFLLVFLAVLLAAGLALGQVDFGWSEDLGMIVGAGVSAAAALLASWVLTEKVEGVPLASVGLPVDGLLPRELGRGFLVGVVLIALAVGAMAAAGWVSWTLEPDGFAPGAFFASLVEVTVFLAVAAFLEELIFRGYPFQVTAEALGGGWALALTSAAFAVAHAWNPGLGPEVLLEGASLERVLPLVNIGLAGLVLGLAYWRTYSLWFATGLHLGWNWTMGFAADLPVSGLEPDAPGYGLFETPGFDAVVQGPTLWTGGGFGPEGGLAVTLASLAGIAWLASSDALSRALRVRALGPLPDRGRDEAGEPSGRPAGGGRGSPVEDRREAAAPAAGGERDDGEGTR